MIGKRVNEIRRKRDNGRMEVRENVKMQPGPWRHTFRCARSRGNKCQVYTGCCLNASSKDLTPKMLAFDISGPNETHWHDSVNFSVHEALNHI
jgi:hypothetical protein